MSLPVGQQRALSQIEQALAEDHPDLGPLFAMFTRLAGQEAMPVSERVTTRSPRLPWPRPMWPTAAGVVGLALVAVVLFTLSLTLPSRPACTGTAASVAARMQAVPSESQAACGARQSGLTRTGPAGAGATPAKPAG